MSTKNRLLDNIFILKSSTLLLVIFKFCYGCKSQTTRFNNLPKFFEKPEISKLLPGWVSYVPMREQKKKKPDEKGSFFKLGSAQRCHR